MKALEIPTKGITREQWLEERRKGIGGSDAAAIMGANPYRSPLAVYYDKLGLLPEQDTTEAMRQGTDLEEYVAKRFTEATNKSVRRVNRILQHPERPWMLANIDRAVIGESAGLECKTTSVYNNADFQQGEVPLTYLWQCVHYMAVTGWNTWYLAVLVLNKAFYTFKLERDDALIERLIDEESRFWNEHVLAQMPPFPSGTDDDDDIVKYVTKQSQHGEDDEQADLSQLKDDLDMLPLLMKERDLTKQRYEAARQRIRLALDGRTYGACAGWYVSDKTQSRTDLDGKRLKADHPDIYSKYSSTTSYPVLRVKEA